MRALLLAALLAGCIEPRSAACTKVCKREAECVEEIGNKVPFDERECVAACSALEQDTAVNAAKVQRHIECVTRQQACPAILECK